MLVKNKHTSKCTLFNSQHRSTIADGVGQGSKLPEKRWTWHRRAHVLTSKYEGGEAISFHFVCAPYVSAMVANRILKIKQWVWSIFPDNDSVLALLRSVFIWSGNCSIVWWHNSWTKWEPTSKVPIRSLYEKTTRKNAFYFFDRDS